MPSHGRVDSFDPNVESWTQYSERLEDYFVANEIDDDQKKRAIFLTVLGASAYRLLRTLVSPLNVRDFTFDQLVQHLSSHYSPKPSEIMERFHFHSRARKAGESISSFICELRRLAEHCDFGTSLNVMLRDRLVCGIQDVNIQKRLLAESELPLTKAIDIATAMETASKNSLDLSNTLRADSTNKVHSKPGREKKGVTFKNTHSTVSASCAELYTCIRCGRQKHSPSAHIRNVNENNTTMSTCSSN